MEGLVLGPREDIILSIWGSLGFWEVRRLEEAPVDWAEGNWEAAFRRGELRPVMAFGRP